MARVLSQMSSEDSAQRVSIRNMMIKNRREQNEAARLATSQSVISKLSFLTMATVITVAMCNPGAIKPIWDKIAPYVLL